MIQVKSCENFLLPVILSSVFLTPFVVLYISSSLFFPYITGKGLLFRFLVEISFCSWIVLAVFNKDYRPRKSFILWSVVVTFGVMTLSTIFSEDVGNSFWSNFERMEGLVTYLHLMAYFIVLVSVFKSEKLWHRFFNAQILTSILVAFYGLLQLAGVYKIMQGGGRLDATLGNAGYLGGFMLMSFFITAYMLSIKWQERSWRYIYISIMILQSFILFETATRGSILALIGGSILALLVFVIFLGKNYHNIRKISLILLGLIFLGLIIFYGARDTAFVKNQPVLSRFADISLNDGTAKSRFLIWDMSWQAVKEKPILGWGPENFPLVFDKYYDPQMYNQEPWFDRSHNVFFDWFVAGGFLGILAYLSMFVSAVWYLFRENIKRLKISSNDSAFNCWQQGTLLAFLGSYFFHNLFIFDNIISYGIFFALLAFIHVKATEDSKAGLVFSKSFDLKNKNIITITTAVAILFFFTSFYFSVAKPALAASALVGAISSASGGDINNSLLEFKKVFSYNTLGQRQSEEQLLSVASGVISATSVPENIKSEFRNLVLKEVVPELEANPRLVRERLILVDYLLKSGNLDSAIAEMEEIRLLSPKKQMIVSNLGYMYLFKDDKQKAEIITKESFDLNPKNAEAGKVYALVLIASGKESQALEVLKSLSLTLAVDDERFLNYYFSNKRYNLVSDILRQRVILQPNNIDLWTNLALSHYAAGNNIEAFKVLDEAVVINPSFKDKVLEVRQAIQSGSIKVN